MAKLRPPFDHIADDLIATLRSAHDHHSKHYEHYPCALAVENVLRKYDLRLRTQPLDRAEIQMPDPVCAVCSQPLGDHVRTGARLLPGEERLRMHPECVSEGRRG